MIIKCSTPLKNLKGEVVKDQDGEVVTLGKALSNIIISAKEGGKMKLFIMGKKLFSQDKIDVDASDLALIKRTVESTEIYNALIAGQIEEILSNIKEK